MDVLKLKKWLDKKNLPAYRFTQITEAVFQKAVGGWNQVVVLPQSLRQQLQKEIPLLSFKLKKIQVAKDNRAHKALLELKDGQKIETVLLNPKPKLWSCCLSTQVGCALGCIFCATAKMGLVRNLTAEEITDQVLFWRQYMRQKAFKDRLGHVVLMGMGEPLANRKAVFASLKILNNPQFYNIGQRNLSLSTSGLVSGIVDFGKMFPQANLAVSLHAANDQLRFLLMPKSKNFPLSKLTKKIKTYLESTRRKVFLEYILFAGVNDQKKHALELKKLVDQIGAPHLLHLNLIRFNPTDGPFQPPKRKQIIRFKKWLAELGLKVTIRKSLGQDIKAACGQLTTAMGRN